ncbi:MAG: hypothetical protein K8R23_02930 [Chthoniobacter sp.]|nr:hypothetical protein [Chthoniobacter sp.]
MTLPKLSLPLLAAAMSLGGCVYDEYDTVSAPPRRVYQGGYARREIVVEREPVRYYDDRRYYRNDYDHEERYYQEPSRQYYQSRPSGYYERRPQPYANRVIITGDHRNHGDYETPEERRRREIREAQRHEKKKNDKKDDKKDDDKKKRKHKD